MRRAAKQQAGEDEIQQMLRELVGLGGAPVWLVQVERHRRVTRADVGRMWLSTTTQAQASNRLPVLMYRADRADWRALWPLAVLVAAVRAEDWQGLEWTALTTVQAWAAVSSASKSNLTG